MVSPVVGANDKFENVSIGEKKRRYEHMRLAYSTMKKELQKARGELKAAARALQKEEEEQRRKPNLTREELSEIETCMFDMKKTAACAALTLVAAGIAMLPGSVALLITFPKNR